MAAPQKVEAQTKGSNNLDHKNTKQLKKRIKIILLGPGESGKSTIFKQMRIIHDINPVTIGERLRYGVKVQECVVAGYHQLLEVCERRNVVDKIQDQAAVALIRNTTRSDTLTPAVGAAMSSIWSDPAVQMVWSNRNSTQLPDSLHYFTSHMSRIAARDYIATTEDYVHVRLRTHGVSSSLFTMENIPFEIYDVGGQRNERRKWIHHFDNVDAVIFVAALSEYDQVLFEDDETNRMMEALALFEEICSLKYFVATDIILFLNKYDLFLEKLPISPIDKCEVAVRRGGETERDRPWQQYTGGSDPVQARRFFQELFVARNKVSNRTIYAHVTTATSTENVRVVFENCKKIVLGRNLEESGF